ncbi:cellulose biosynthesis cyclic di-GMP-binding regulatory protein BcsB [Caulobacter sp. NIBR2454]|uniref:cellulose biosynthesis cyclic di-GMP-binding regulatory protein BcsB n=1 Tax=Caulobacter sp. NIBR2454 TaxID=3015996 RepID=UPI0022B60282|nr:cellulose biosynthesis cyclic di-GMP-binding regulatory protein BcsB [Caulobacter sp. NIBR2454]
MLPAEAQAPASNPTPANPAAAAPSNVPSTPQAPALVALSAGPQPIGTQPIAQAYAQPVIQTGPLVETPRTPDVQSFSLADLEVKNPLRMISVDGEFSVPFNLSADSQVTAASLRLRLTHSPAMLPDLSQLVIYINDEVIGAVRLDGSGEGGMTIDIPVDPSLFGAKNRLNLRFLGHYTRGCENPLHPSLWAEIDTRASRLSVTTVKGAPRLDLARLPSPFFEGLPGGLNVPFAFASQPSDQALQAASAVASYFALAADYQSFRFPVVLGALPAGNGVVFATSGEVIGGMSVGAVNEPTLRLIENPVTPGGVLLLVLGRDREQLLAAGRTLALGSVSLRGAYAPASAVNLQQRKPYDAPRWLRTDRPVRFGELADQSAMQTVGAGAPVIVPIRTAPDLFLWPSNVARMKLRYRYGEGDWLNLDASRLDVSINGTYVKSLGFRDRSRADPFVDRLPGYFTLKEAKVELPSYMLFGQNELNLYFNIIPRTVGNCKGELPVNLRSGIDPDSTIDITGAAHFGSLPNLAYFTGSIFPFTRLADLSETAVVLSSNPTAAELEALFAIIGQAAESTGVAATGVTITRNSDAATLAEKDVLLIGSTAMAATHADLFTRSPFIPTETGLTRRARLLDGLSRLFGGNGADAALRGQDFQGLASFRSPYGGRRVVVAVLSSDAAALPGTLRRLAAPSNIFKVQGDLTVDGADGVKGYRVGPIFWRGTLSPVIFVLWWFSRNPLLLAVGFVLAALLLSGPIFLAYKALEKRRLHQ